MATKRKAFYLLDTNAALCHYIPDEKVTRQLNHIIEQHGLKQAFLFIPKFCISELFNTFAKLYYRKKETYPQELQDLYFKNVKSLPMNEYQDVCRNFREDIKFGRLFYAYELSRYHTFNADHVITFEHQTNLIRKNPKTGKEEAWFLSSFDILIIAMGIELVRLNGDDKTFILTCDRRIKVVAENMRKALKSDEVRRKYNIPEYIYIPQVFYLHETSIEYYPKFAGQSQY